MKKTKLIFPALVVGIVSISIGASSVFAYQGDYTKKGPNYTEERHTIMQNAFKTNNYEAWKTEMEKTNSGKRILSVINKDNFAKFAEANRLGLEGKTAEADKIRAELGLRTSNSGPMGRGQGKIGRGQGMGIGCTR